MIINQFSAIMIDDVNYNRLKKCRPNLTKFFGSSKHFCSLTDEFIIIEIIVNNF